MSERKIWWNVCRLARCSGFSASVYLVAYLCCLFVSLVFYGYTKLFVELCQRHILYRHLIYQNLIGIGDEILEKLFDYIFLYIYRCPCLYGKSQSI